MSGKDGRCEVCRADGASHQFDMLKHSGGGAVFTCPRCTDLAKQLATAVKDDRCLWCLEPATGKYEWLRYDDGGGVRHRICGECRREIWRTGAALSRTPWRAGE